MSRCVLLGIARVWLVIRVGMIALRRFRAGVAQLVELQPSKLDVASSNLVARSTVLKRSGVPGVGWPLRLLEPT